MFSLPSYSFHLAYNSSSTNVYLMKLEWISNLGQLTVFLDFRFLICKIDQLLSSIISRSDILRLYDLCILKPTSLTLLFGALRNGIALFALLWVASSSLSHSYWKQFQRACTIAVYLVWNNLENCPFNIYFYSLRQSSLLHGDCWDISRSFLKTSSILRSLILNWLDWLDCISACLSVR